MPTDPTKFRGMRPSAAHALAEIIDNVDEASDTGALVGKCDFEIELASAIAWQIEEGSGDAAELRELGLPATPWPGALPKRSTNRVAIRRPRWTGSPVREMKP